MNGTEVLALAVWYALIALVDGAVLTIQANATGQGLCNMTVQADLIAANVSLAANNTSWHVLAGSI